MADHTADDTQRQPSGRSAPLTKPLVPTSRDRTVLVVHGRDEAARGGLFTFLRSIGLHPYEWTEVLAGGRGGAPYLGDVLIGAMNASQAIVVLLTPDDVAQLERRHAERDEELQPMGQARPDVLFKAGMALAAFPDNTILVELGRVRPFSDVGSRFVVPLDDSVERRQGLAVLLRNVGCAVNLDGVDWHRAGKLSPTVPKSIPVADRARASNGEAFFRSVTVEAAGRDRYAVSGEVRSLRPRRCTLFLEATFLNSRGEVLGVANGLVSDVIPGEFKDFRLTTGDHVAEHTEVRLQIVKAFP